MTDTALEDRVVAFITKRGGGVSFVELEREFPDEFEEQDNELCFTNYYNVMLCQPVSLAMAWALDSAINNGRIVMNPKHPIVYSEDGVVPVVPIARRARQDGAARWLPMTLSPAEAGDRKDCGDLAS